VAEQLPEGLKVYANGNESDVAFTLTGATYIGGVTDGALPSGNRLVLFGEATFDGNNWVHPDDFIRTAFGFGLDFDGGIVNITNASTSYTLFDGMGGFLAGVGSSGFNAFDLEPGGYGFGFAYEDRFGSNFETGTTISWEILINFEWLDVSESNTLNFHIPQNSIDIQTIPAPGGLVLASLGVIAGLRRRR
jgi:hypothetical protein